MWLLLHGANLSLQCVSQVLCRERVCVSEIGKEINDADVEEEVATGDSRFFLVISILAIHHPIGVYLLGGMEDE